MVWPWIATPRFIVAHGPRGTGVAQSHNKENIMRTPIAAAALLAFASLPHVATAQLVQTLDDDRGTGSRADSDLVGPVTRFGMVANVDSAKDADTTAHTDTAAYTGITAHIDTTANANPVAYTHTVANAGTAVSTSASATEARSCTGDDPVRRGALVPIVVSAARNAQALPDALPQTTLFDRRAIEDSSATDLAGLLQFAPGVQITRNGGAGQTAGLFMRGAPIAQTLVMIDGVRVDSAALGATQIAQIPLDQVERVEVVNGNVSALYGSSAIGGVVQVFTRDGGNYPPRFTLDGEYGSYRTQRQHAGVNGALDVAGATTFSVDASRMKTDGFSSIDPNRAPVNPNANGTFNESVSASLKHRFSPGWDAGIRYFQSFSKTSFDNPFGMPTDLNKERDRVGQVSVFVNGGLTERWSTHLSVAQGTDRSQIFVNGQQTSRYDTTNGQLDWQNDYAIAAGHKLVFGYQHINQDLDASDFTTPARRVNSGYVGYNGELGRNEMQFNLRRDQYSDFGGANSYFVGYGYRFTDHWKAIVNYSDAFRAPTFNDLYFPFSGDPSLKPEQAHSLETALQYASPALGVARVTAFQTRYRNLIQYALADHGRYVAQNVGRAKVQGIEASWSGQVGRTDVRASFTFQNPVDEVSDRDLTRRPRRFATVSANHSFDGWRIGGQWLLTGARHDNGQPMGGYGVVNLSARYNITKSWYVAARVENLFDKDYETLYTYNTPKRGAYLTLGWQQQ